MGFCILDHLINLVFIKAAGRYNRNLLLTTGSFVTSGYIHNAVRVNVKGHLNLRDTTWCRGNAIQNEATERAVSLANSRSPCRTLISTLGWLSLAVEKTCVF